MEIDVNQILEIYEKQYADINRRFIMLSLESEERFKQIQNLKLTIAELQKELEKYEKKDE